MTRLKTEWIEDIKIKAREKEAILKEKTGLGYAALAAKASGWSVADIERASQQIVVGTVPVTSGEGVIGSFAEGVAAVASVMGFRSFVTECFDVNGIYEAYKREADIIFMADDDRYISFNLNKKKMADNNVATAAGYLTALEEAQGPLVGKEVLLLGFGVLGQEFLKRLLKKGIFATGYDLDEKRLKAMGWSGAAILEKPEDMKRFKVVIDATNSGGWIKPGMLQSDAWIASPGIPQSLDEEAFQIHKDRVISDFMEIGTAAMLGFSL
jgi:pyrrolysine biosynthesis protein PylD